MDMIYIDMCSSMYLSVFDICFFDTNENENKDKNIKLDPKT